MTDADPLALRALSSSSRSSLAGLAAFGVAADRAGLAASARFRSTAALRVRGRRVFGDNKTVRGFVVDGAGGGVGVLALSAVAVDARSRRASRATCGRSRRRELRRARRVGGTRLHARRAAELVRQATARRRARTGAARPTAARRVVRRRSHRLDRRNVARGHRSSAPTPWMTWVYVLAHRPGDPSRVQRAAVPAGREGAGGMTAVETSSTRRAIARAATSVRALGEPSDATLVGGKAYALGRMMRAGLRVPDGFVLTTDAFDEHLDGLRTRDRATRRRRSRADERRAVRRRRAVLSAGVARAVGVARRCWRAAGGRAELGDRRRLARASRSPASSTRFSTSTTMRRSSEAVLDVLGVATGRSASLFYRAARGVPASGMGVVVQQQVDARAAGVLFTDDGRRRDARRVRRGPRRRARRRRDRSGRACRSIATTGDVAASRRAPTTSFALERRGDRRAARAAARDSSASSAHRRTSSGRSATTARSGSFSRVRSRRAVSRRSRLRRGRADDAIAWSNANVNENFPGPISPLLYSIASPGYTHYFRNLARAFGISPQPHSRDGAGVSPDHRRARRADVLQPDVDPLGAAARAVRRGARGVVRHVRRRRWRERRGERRAIDTVRCGRPPRSRSSR